MKRATRTAVCLVLTGLCMSLGCGENGEDLGEVETRSAVPLVLDIHRVKLNGLSLLEVTPSVRRMHGMGFQAVGRPGDYTRVIGDISVVFPRGTKEAHVYVTPSKILDGSVTFRAKGNHFTLSAKSTTNDVCIFMGKPDWIDTDPGLDGTPYVAAIVYELPECESVFLWDEDDTTEEVQLCQLVVRNYRRILDHPEEFQYPDHNPKGWKQLPVPVLTQRAEPATE